MRAGERVRQRARPRGHRLAGLPIEHVHVLLPKRFILCPVSGYEIALFLQLLLDRHEVLEVHTVDSQLEVFERPRNFLHLYVRLLAHRAQSTGFVLLIFKPVRAVVQLLFTECQVCGDLVYVRLGHALLGFR